MRHTAPTDLDVLPLGHVGVGDHAVVHVVPHDLRDVGGVPRHLKGGFCDSADLNVGGSRVLVRHSAVRWRVGV